MANVLRGTCAHDCSTTWWRTTDVATGPGEVRRCEHGNVWVWSHRENSALDITSFDRWRRAHPMTLLHAGGGSPRRQPDRAGVAMTTTPLFDETAGRNRDRVLELLATRPPTAAQIIADVDEGVEE